MNMQAALQSIVRPTLIAMEAHFGILLTAEAECLLLAIGMQESRFTYRAQIGGPAKGYWQFERGGGVTGVMNHIASRRIANQVLSDHNIEVSVRAAYEALETNDTVACTFARLLLLTDPKPLPSLVEPLAAWRYYQRNWRPGKPHPGTWFPFHQHAVEAIKSNP